MSPRGICILIATLKINTRSVSKLEHIYEIKENIKSLFKNSSTC